MGICLFENSGGGIDTDGLTASSTDVISGKTFVGAGSDDLQTGSMPDRGSPSIVLPVNGTHNFPAGRYTGGSVTQNIQTVAGRTVNPGATAQTLSVAGKKLSGNIVVNAVANLKPENIKKGVVVGGVTGTWEGYVNNDPDRPYYRGVFLPDQGLTLLEGPEAGDHGYGSATFERDYILISYERGPTVCVLDGSIDFSKYKNIEVSATPGENLGHIHFFQNRVYSYLYQSTSGTTTKYNPALGNMLMDSNYLHLISPYESGIYSLNKDFSVNSSGFCYFSFTRQTDFRIRSIKFIKK